MSDLFAYIDKCLWGRLFAPNEGSHIVPHTYNVIKRAAHDQADKLILTPTEFVWFKRDVKLGQFPVAYPESPQYSFRRALSEILRRDAVVKRHLRLVSETQDEIVCEFQVDDNGKNDIS